MWVSNNFMSARGNLPEIISTLFRRFVATELTNIFQHVHCRWNNFEIILELLQRPKYLYFSFGRGYMWNKTLK